MVIYLDITLDVYFINYNTKRDYQMEQKSGIQTRPKSLQKYIITFLAQLVATNWNKN